MTYVLVAFIVLLLFLWGIGLMKIFVQNIKIVELQLQYNYKLREIIELKAELEMYKNSVDVGLKDDGDQRNKKFPRNNN